MVGVLMPGKKNPLARLVLMPGAVKVTATPDTGWPFGANTRTRRILVPFTTMHCSLPPTGMSAGKASGTFRVIAVAVPGKKLLPLIAILRKTGVTPGPRISSGPGGYKDSILGRRLFTWNVT